MNKILEALANDNLCINPTTYKKGTEYARAVKTTYETAEELDKKLNEEERKLFMQFQDSHTEAEHLYAVDRFVRGFRVAVLMMFEVFTENDSLFYGKGEGKP